MEAAALGYPPAGELTCFHSTGYAEDLILPSRYRALILTPSDQTSGIDLPAELADYSIVSSIEVDTQSSLSTDGGLSIDLRRQLVARPNPAVEEGVLLLSMDLQRSFWGDPQSASDSLGWISAHPWIQPISLERFSARGLSIHTPELESGSEKSTTTSFGSFPQPVSLEKALSYLGHPNSSGLQSFAWYLLYRSHSSPACTASKAIIGGEEDKVPNCKAFQREISKGFQSLSAIQSWEGDLKTAQVPDQIEIQEDSDQEDLTMIDYPAGGWLSMVNPDTEQLDSVFFFNPVKGSTPIIWNLEPAPQGRRENIDYEISFRSEKDQLEIEFHNRSPITHFHLPVYLSQDLLTRVESCVTTDRKTGVVLLGCEGDTQLQIGIENANWTFASVLDSPGRWSMVEDPNLEVPPGHFLPIPYGVLQVEFVDRVTLFMRVIE
jgi:hypothetical protein